MRGLRRALCRQRHRRRHRIEKRQRERGAQAAQNGAPRKRLLDRRGYMSARRHLKCRTLDDSRVSTPTSENPAPPRRGRCCGRPGGRSTRPCGRARRRAASRSRCAGTVRAARAAARAARSAPRRCVPLIVVPAASTGLPASSTLRQPPMTSKFSSAKPERIDDRVAARACRVGAMLRPAARGSSGGAAPGLAGARFVSTPGGGGGSLQAEDVVQQEFSAKHRRRAIGIRRRRQQRALREQPAALVRVGQRHAPEAAAVNAGDAVVPRELLVDERVVGIEQLEDAAILAQRAADEQLRLALERVHQREVVIRIALGIDDDFGHAAQVQPLRGEIVDERVGRRADRRASASPAARAPADRTACAVSASVSSWSSGMLDHRKNDRREASSRSDRR